jgi:nitrite reductase/ring-hydroxylating ferredoxin subunit
MSEYIKLCTIDDIKEGHAQKIELSDQEVAVFKIKDEIFILNNLCSHQHAPVIADGIINEYTVTCPRHGWIFDLRTGKSASGDSPIRKYNYKIENSIIYIEK